MTGHDLAAMAIIFGSVLLLPVMASLSDLIDRIREEKK